MRLLAGGTPLQVTQDNADHQYPRWSPDSSWLIYFSSSQEPDGEGKIWQISALGGTARPLVSSLGGADLSDGEESDETFTSLAARKGLWISVSAPARSLPMRTRFRHCRYSGGSASLRRRRSSGAND